MTFDTSFFDVECEDAEDEAFFFTDSANANAAREWESNPAWDDDKFDDWEDFENWDGMGMDDVRMVFNPKPKDWRHVPFTNVPKVTMDKARNDCWENAKKEINFIRDKIESMNVSGATNDMEKVALLLCGRDSNLFHHWKKIVGSSYPTTYLDFAEWIGAFYFSCHMGKNYTKLEKATRVDTDDFASSIDYNKVWNCMEEYAKGNPFKDRSWMLFQDALNSTLKENFLPSPKELAKQIICLDDDKALMDYRSLREVPVDEDSRLARKRHASENRNGFTGHLACFAGSGLPLRVAFEMVGYGLFDTVVELFQALYGTRTGPDIPDLTNIATLNADRQYLRINLLAWWLATGGNLLGTNMRQPCMALTFGKSSEQAEKMGQLNVPIDTQKVVHQATYDHNCGGKTPGDSRSLTNTAYSSGISSAVNLSLSSEHHERHWDYVFANPKDLAWYNKTHLLTYERQAHGYEHLAGSPDPVLEALEDHDSSNPITDSTNIEDWMVAREEMVYKMCTGVGNGHIDFLYSQVEAITSAQLDAAWWTSRFGSQTSSTSYHQFKLLFPTIGINHELREEFEIIAACANMTKLLPSTTVNGDDDNGSDEEEEEELPPLDLTTAMKKRFKDLLRVLGEE